MPEFDLILRGGNVVTENKVQITDLGITDGKIAGVGLKPNASAHETIGAEGFHIFPGVIDAHVHFNDPGRTNWEGIATGSSALAAGGGTLFFDMPLNAHPPTIDADSFDLKLAVAKEKSLTDFALWGGLVPENLRELDGLAERGVVGFKAFMSDSGIDDFTRTDDHTLREGMKRVVRWKLPVAVHAESEILTKQLARECLAKGQTSIRDYLNSRPVAAELEAIHRAIDMAGETGCTLHIVHVSSSAGINAVAEARKQGADVSCETCPHYLVLTEDDVEKLGAIAKCAPPLRTTEERDSLWACLQSGKIQTVGSDHSPSPPDMKTDANFFKVWGGISGVQHLLPLMLTEGYSKRKVALELISRLLSTNVATRFKLPGKGRIAVGFDADFVLVDLQKKHEVRTEDLLYQHRQSPYIGRTLQGQIKQTILRGQTIFRDGKVIAKPQGLLVKPAQ